MQLRRGKLLEGGGKEQARGWQAGDRAKWLSQVLQQGTQNALSLSLFLALFLSLGVIKMAAAQIFKDGGDGRR